MLACSCELLLKYCKDCSVLRKHQAKRQIPETRFLRLVNGKCLPYDEAKKYFTGNKANLQKSLEICMRED